jgi:hypothetical protein
MILSGSGLLSKFIEQPGLATLLSACYEERLGCLGEPAASRLIKEGLSEVSEVEEEAVSLLYNITIGNPYYLQLLCYKLHERAQEDGMAITHTFTSQIIDEWLAQADESRFLHLWAGNDKSEAQRNKAILSAIAHLGLENREVAYGPLCEVLCPHIEEKDLLHALEDLVYMNVLKHDQLNYAIEVDLLALWLRKHWPLPFALKEAGLL